MSSDASLVIEEAPQSFTSPAIKEAQLSRPKHGILKTGQKHVEIQEQPQSRRMQQLKKRHRSGSKRSEDGSTEYSETGVYKYEWVSVSIIQVRTGINRYVQMHVMSISHVCTDVSDKKVVLLCNLYRCE